MAQTDPSVTPAHDQKIGHHYVIHFPSHYPRDSDPHYHLFEAYRKSHVAMAKCYVGERVGFQECAGGLELHHAYLEFAVVNAALIEAIQKDFPAVTDEASLASWAESEQNFRFLCQFHHRGHAGAHVASHSDFESECYVKNFIS